MLAVSNLEMDVAYACNLQCEGCTHYSNYGIRGCVKFSEGAEWLHNWAARISPKAFSLLGGEPMLNPELCDYIRLAAVLWPESLRSVVTNGFLLDRQPGLMRVLAESGTRLIVSLHSNNSDYERTVREQLVRLAGSEYAEKVQLFVRDSQWFYRTYTGEGPAMRPYHDGNPEQSWEVCHNKDCFTLHLGRIWKCPPIAFLGFVAEKFGLDKIDEWKPYLEYRGIEPSADNRELAAFFARGHECTCGMCPSTLQGYKTLPD